MAKSQILPLRIAESGEALWVRKSYFHRRLKWTKELLKWRTFFQKAGYFFSLSIERCIYRSFLILFSLFLNQSNKKEEASLPLPYYSTKLHLHLPVWPRIWNPSAKNERSVFDKLECIPDSFSGSRILFLWPLDLRIFWQDLSPWASNWPTFLLPLTAIRWSQLIPAHKNCLIFRNL